MLGTDPGEAAAIINGELDLSHLAELPGRGIGADMIGRMAALLVEMPIDSATWGYRLGSRGSSVARRARGFLAADLDAVEQIWDDAGFIGAGRQFKVQLAGPFTLAASVELANGHKAIRDRGALRDLIDSTAEGLAIHIAEVRRRLGAEVIVQLDEPMIGAVIDGTLTPLTTLDPIRAIPAADVAQALTSVVQRVDRPAIIHNCAAPRWDLIEKLPGMAHTVDVSGKKTLSAADLDGIGALIDRGDVLVAGTVPTDVEDRFLRAETVATGLAELMDRIGLNRKVLAENVIVTPVCGLAGVRSAYAKRTLEICAQAGEFISGDPDAL